MGYYVMDSQVGSTKEDVDALRKPCGHGRLFFAGEATSALASQCVHTRVKCRFLTTLSATPIGYIRTSLPVRPRCLYNREGRGGSLAREGEVPSN